MRSRTTIENELHAIADELEQLARRQEELFARRLDVWLEGREPASDGRPFMLQHELAAPSRVSEGAVTQALRKHDLRNGARVAS